jgi:hypothetical protein
VGAQVTQRVCKIDLRINARPCNGFCGERYRSSSLAITSRCTWLVPS